MGGEPHAKVAFRSNARYHADGIPVYFGSAQDSRVLYDGTNDEWTVQTKDNGGTQTDRIQVKGNQDITQVQIYNDDPGATGIQLDVYHESASPADADVLFHVRVYGEDSGGTKTQFGGIKFTANDITDTTEDGKVELEYILAGTLQTGLELSGGVATFQNPTDAISNQVGIFRGGNRATPADNDEAYLSFTLDDDNGAQQEYFRLTWIATDVTNTTKDGRVTFAVMTGNSLTEMFRLDSTTAGVITMTYSTGDIILDDNVSLQLGTAAAESDLSSDGTNTIWNMKSGNLTLQVGGATDAILSANLLDLPDGTVLEVNEPVKWDTGAAFTAGNYEVGRNADGTNLFQLNVPTGASFELSVNDVAELTLSATDLNLQSNDLLDPGAAGNEWLANALTQSNGASTSNMVHTIENTTNSGASHAYLELKVGGTTSTGDPHIRFTIPSGTSYILGSDNSSADRFILATGSALASNHLLRIDGRTSGFGGYSQLELRPHNTTHDNDASSAHGAILISARTATLSGTATVSDFWALVDVRQLSISASGGAVAVNDVGGLRILAAVPSHADVTITDSSAVYVPNPGTITGTLTNLFGVRVANQSRGTNNYGISIVDAGTASLWFESDGADAASGISFGASRDTTLYRSAANRLRTDDTFEAATALRMAAPNTVAGTGLMLTTNDGTIQEVMRDSSTIELKSDWDPIGLNEARQLLRVTAGHYRMGEVPDAGFYVEDFEEAGITDILAYSDGKPTAFKTFGRGIAAYMLPLVQDHEKRLTDIEQIAIVLRAQVERLGEIPEA